MPICNKPAMPVGSRKGSTEIDDHASEAAKLKRAREQAYFNSYNFDAIEVLPYDNEASEADEDDADTAAGAGAGKNGVQYVNTRGKALVKYQRKERLPKSQQSIGHDTQKAVASSSSSNISSSGSAHSDSNKILSMKYAYLQRLGTLFVKSHQNHADPKEAMNPVNTEVQANVNDANFLLPRAMLKYQSSSIGASNSMPLTVIAMQEQHQHQHPQQHPQQPTQLQQAQQQIYIGAGKTPQNDDNKIGNSHKSIMMANNAISLVSALLPSGGAEQHQTRLNYATTLPSNGHEDAMLDTGFLTLKENLVTKKTQPRSKKQSTGSTYTTTTATTASLELPAATNHSTDATIVIMDNEKNSNSNSNSVKGKSKSKATKQMDKSLDLSTATTKTTTKMAATTENSDAHGRAHSHQSHYSTDKSGSSGYYSSNVCSTYSIEDHIYCEPVIDILDLNGKCKSGHKKAEAIFTTNTKRQQQQMQQQKLPPLSVAATLNLSGKVHLDEAHAASQTRAMKAAGTSQRLTVGGASDDTEADEDENDGKQKTSVVLRRSMPQDFSEKLRTLETSIDNLDRHLKSFPNLTTQDRIVSFVQTHQHFLQHNDLGEKLRLPYNNHLPTIMEGYDPANQPRPWQDDIADDSLLDIDLDSFLLTNEAKDKKRKATTAAGIDNPTFITDELEENNYKCAKYINSCPDNAYFVESDIGASESRGSASQKSMSAEHYLRRYEDQLHFQNTRELLEDVRDKIRILSQSKSSLESNSTTGTSSRSSHNKQTIPFSPQSKQVAQIQSEVPKELGVMIRTLKSELESYLDRMNQHSEYEIRQLYTGLVKNENILKMKKAFDRRRSITENDYYEAINGDASAGPLRGLNTGVPQVIRQQIASIRCASDPNFKMKRKSLNEVFPAVNCYLESIHESRNRYVDPNIGPEQLGQSQMQRNLSFHKPVLNQLDSKVVTNDIKHAGNAQNQSGGSVGNALNGRNSTESGESGGDKDSILEWHRKKPSIWEMYYGTNRMHQSLLGKRNGMVVNVNQSTMSYPSSRPESDFTLDLPRAEQLRIKMEKEKKFRQRCRYITTFLSLVFFLLTVMVVSLVLTRGKRMFGSMI